MMGYEFNAYMMLICCDFNYHKAAQEIIKNYKRGFYTREEMTEMIDYISELLRR